MPASSPNEPLTTAAQSLVKCLAAAEVRIVFAESCTGGLIASELAKVPGVSQWLCGSAVTYRCDTKVQWLDVQAEDIDQHTAVSRQVAHQMAQGVLQKTPEAIWSAAITGHLGPHAPPEFDGVVFIGIGQRSGTSHQVDVTRHQLVASQRLERQEEAAIIVMRLAQQSIAKT